jgi:hypothetical protein
MIGRHVSSDCVESRLEKHWFFGKFQERGGTTKRRGTMVNLQVWFHQQLWLLLWKGPGAVSACLSASVLLICVCLSAISSTASQIASLGILSLNVVVGILLILVDEIGSCRSHRLGLLRFAAANSHRRIEKLGVKSKQIDRFVDAVCLNPELEHTFRRTRLQSVELMVQALDILSRTASRYGRPGRKVFELNKDALVSAMWSFECLSFADAEEVLVEQLKAWLKDPPDYDPEGWALALFRRS